MSMQSTDTPRRRRSRRQRTPSVDVSKLTAKISLRNLEFFYGDSRALKGITLSLYANKVTAFIGPSGCGKSTLLRVLNRMYDLYPGQRATGEVMFDGENLLRRRPGPQPAARAHRHGVPEADAVPDDDLREHRLRHPALREAAASRNWTAGSSTRCAAPRCGTRSRTS